MNDIITQMRQDKSSKGCWWGILFLALIGIIIFSLIIAVPFAAQKTWVDSMVADGNFESFSYRVFKSIRIVLLPSTIILIALVVYLLVLRRHSQSNITKAKSWLLNFLSHRWQEIRELWNTVLPSNQDLVSIVILLGIISLGLFFRYAYLWRPMGHDETYTFMAFAYRGLRVVVTDYHLPNNHVFHTILVNLLYQLLGDSPAVIRLAALIAGLLIIPATYLVAKIFYDWRIGLISASIVAALPVLVDYSTTARGYTLITLFALIIVAISAYIKDHQNIMAWMMFIGFSSFGLYTNPTMIYPIGVAYTWLFLSGLIKDISPNYGKRFYNYLAASILVIVLLTGILYLPIIFTSGIQSLVGNDVIESLSWSDFLESLMPRIRNTWKEWNRSLSPIISALAVIGLAASIFIPKRPSNRRVPLIFAAFLWIAIALGVQRVAPWPRIWLFLLPFFVVWITAGIFGLIQLFLSRTPKSENIMTVLMGFAILFILIAGIIQTYPQYTDKLYSKGEVEQVADFLQEYLQDGDVVVVTSPDTIVLKYYMMRNDLAKDYTELIKDKKVSRAIVVVNKGYGQTIDYVLERRSYLDDVDLSSGEEIYRSDRFSLYEYSSN